jgi:hypothetical protein
MDNASTAVRIFPRYYLRIESLPSPPGSGGKDPMLSLFSLLCQCCSSRFLLVSSLSHFVYFSLCSDMGSADLGLSFLLASSHLGLILPFLLESTIYSLCFTFDGKHWKPATLTLIRNYWTDTKSESHMLPFSICYCCFEYYLIFSVWPLIDTEWRFLSLLIDLFIAFLHFLYSCSR